MLRIGIQILLTLILCLLLSLLIGWWGIGVFAAAVVGFLMHEKLKTDFLAGLLGVGLLWIIMSIWIVASTDSLLPMRMAKLISPSLNTGILIFITGLIGGILGGFGALIGGQIRQTFLPVK